MPKPKLKRIHVQSGVPDRLGRNIPGLFTVLLDPTFLQEQMERASEAKGRRSVSGALVVEFQATPNEAQAEYLTKQFTPDKFEIRGDPRGEDFGR